MPTVKLYTFDGDTLRELTANEYAQYEIDKTAYTAYQTAQAAQAAAKASAEKKLAALGLTADEIAAL